MTKTATIQAQQKWEYHVVMRRSQTGLMEELNEAGQQGWELTSITHDKDPKGELVWTGFLKRPFVPQAGSPAKKPAATETQGPEQQKTEQPDAKPAFDLNGEEFSLRAEES
jgi:hypothetical protein